MEKVILKLPKIFQIFPFIDINGLEEELEASGGMSFCISC